MSSQSIPPSGYDTSLSELLSSLTLGSESPPQDMMEADLFSQDQSSSKDETGSLAPNALPSPLKDAGCISFLNTHKPAEEKDKDGKTALYLATEKGDYDEVKRLLDLGFDPNSTDNQGFSILAVGAHYFVSPEAIATGKQYSLIELLLQRGADPRKLSPLQAGATTKVTCFDSAAIYKNQKLLTLYAKYSPGEPYFTSAGTNQIIRHLVDEKFLRFMLDFSPAHIWIDFQEKWSLLNCDEIRVETVRLLKEKQPEHFQKYLCTTGKSPLYWQFVYTFAPPSGSLLHPFDVELAEIFYENGASLHDLSEFLSPVNACGGAPEITLEIFQWLLRHGVDVNEKSSYGNRTPLYKWLICKKENFRIDFFKELLAAGADITIACGDEGETPLQYVMSHKDEPFFSDILELMRTSPSAAKVINPPLHQAILDKNEIRVRELVLKEDPYQQDPFGRTAAELAIERHDLNSLKVILEKHQLRNLPLLETAAECGTFEIFAFLMTLGFQADPDKTHELKKGQPLEYALQYGQTPIVHWYLQTYPASSHVWGGSTKTQCWRIAYYAAKQGNVEVLQRVVDHIALFPLQLISSSGIDVFENALLGAAQSKQNGSGHFLLPFVKTCHPWKDPQGNNLFHYLAHSQDSSLLLAIREKFPNVGPLLTAKNGKAETPLAIAFQKKNEEVQRILWHRIYRDFLEQYSPKTSSELTVEKDLGQLRRFLEDTIKLGDRTLFETLYENEILRKALSLDENMMYQNNLLIKAAACGKADIVQAMLQHNFPVRVPLSFFAALLDTNSDPALAKALASCNQKIIHSVLEGYRNQGRSPDFDFLLGDLLYGRLGDFKDPIRFLEIILNFYRPGLSKEESQTVLELLGVMNVPMASVHILKYGTSRYESIEELVGFLQETTRFVAQIKNACHLTLEGRDTIEDTHEKIVQQVFQHIFSGMNPRLANEPGVLEKIAALCAEGEKTEDYGSLFLALQVGKNMEMIKAAFHEAKRIDRTGLLPPKALLKLDQRSIQALQSLVLPCSDLSEKTLDILQHSNLSAEEQKSLGTFLSKAPHFDIPTLQRNWLCYVTVYRTRKGLSDCQYILKNYKQHPDLLPYALCAIDSISVPRFNKFLNQKQSSLLQQIVQDSPSQNIRILALKALSAVTRPTITPHLMDFLVRELIRAHTYGEAEYESAVLDTLASYEWNNEPFISQLFDVLSHHFSYCTEIGQQKIALLLSGCAHEKALLFALGIVKSATWDAYATGYGSNRRSKMGSCLMFRSRPDMIHDNRASLIERIENNLAHLHLSDETFEKEVEARYKEFTFSPTDSELALIKQELEFGPDTSIRYFGPPLFFPKGSDLIRGLSTRKGDDSFMESIRDLIRKGSGSATLTDHDAAIDTATWKKVGHIFATHHKDLFFAEEGGCTYFSANESGAISDSALVIVPAQFYEQEYLSGQARMEKEGSYNNVLYRGIPKVWIKAIYVPESLQRDIELLGGQASISPVKQMLTSDTFKKLPEKELVELRRHLQALELDRSGAFNEPVPFFKKIHFFPEGNAKQVEQQLLKDGVHFSTTEDVHAETLKWAIRRQMVRKTYGAKTDNPTLFAGQDTILAQGDDIAFCRTYSQFLALLPQAMRTHYPSTLTVEELQKVGQDIALTNLSPALLRLACLYSLVPGTSDERVQRMKADMRPNPGFFGVTFADVQTLESILGMGKT